MGHVAEFLGALHAKYPETVLVSGGATGSLPSRSVDHVAEQTWLALGGRVWSYRPKKISDEEYAIEFWDLGGEQPRVFVLANEPTWANYASACIYRDLLIADACDRLVAFYRPGKSQGTLITAGLARDYDKPVHVYERSRELTEHGG